jgi:hypothetical protein
MKYSFIKKEKKKSVGREWSKGENSSPSKNNKMPQIIEKIKNKKIKIKATFGQAISYLGFFDTTENDLVFVYLFIIFFYLKSLISTNYNYKSLILKRDTLGNPSTIYEGSLYQWYLPR